MSLKTEVNMQQAPKVSIITVVYNGVTHLEQTIQSVLKQTYKNIEYIIIDGGSTDGTVELIKKYDENIDFWISEKDSGIYDAMNKGIAKATGDVVGLINADDWYELDTVQNIVEAFTTSDVDVVHGAMQIVNDNGSGFLKKVNKSLDNLKKGMLLNHPTVFAKRALYDQYGLFDTSYNIVADWEMMIRWKTSAVKFIGIEKNLANFRMGGVSSEHLIASFKEKHTVRKAYDLYTYIDMYYVYDRFKSIFPTTVLIEVSLFRQKMEI